MEKFLLEQLPRLKKIVYRVLRNPDQVDDVLQECCVKIMEAQSNFNETGSIVGWICVITRNTSITALDKMIRNKKFISDHKEKIHKSIDLKNDVDTFITDDKIKILNDCFHVLTDRQRLVVEMKYYQKMKAVDIARELGVKQATVSGLVKRAIDKLRDEMLIKNINQ